MSTILFHGPGAREEALKEAQRLGKLVVPPIGDDGLKVDEARRVTELMYSTPVGEHLGVVIVGPLDEAAPKSTDTLLKVIEDHPGTYVRLLLWAHDLGGVSSTIKSRCLERWVPILEGEIDDAAKSAAFRILDSGKDHLTIIDLVKSYDKREWILLAALVSAIETDPGNVRYREIWERLRKVAQWKNPYLSEILFAVLQG